MNDTTKWIMIILLLLLIAAAVFVLLRSPGKDDGDGDDDRALAGRGGVDSDRDGVPDAQEDRIEPAGGRADRGVYDQEADTAPPAAERMDEDTTTAPVETSDYDDTRTTPVAAAPAHDEDRWSEEDEDRPVAHGSTAADESAEPYRPEAGAREDDRGVETSDEATTDVHPLTDDDISEGGRQEPLGREDQEPGSARTEPAGVRDDEGPNMTAAAAAGAAGAAGAGGAAVLHDDGTHRTGADAGTDDPSGTDAGYRVDDDATTYRATGGEAVAVDEDRPTTAADVTGTEQDVDRDTLPADAGTGAPQTADEIVGSRDHDRAEDVRDAHAPVFTEAAYGPGSAEPLEDGSGPAGWEIKGNIGSMLFHTPESPSYDSVRAEVWFEDEDAARNAGFAHWDRRRR